MKDNKKNDKMLVSASCKVYLPPVCRLAAATAAAVNPVSPGAAVELPPTECRFSLW